MRRTPPDDRTRVEDALKLGRAIGWVAAAQLLAYEFQLPESLISEIASRLEGHQALAKSRRGSAGRFTTAMIAEWLAAAPKRERPARAAGKRRK